ncbi:MAG: NAD(P)H-dependent glycerol-3-phosphate dehydrogenase [Pseudomonadota bacterium]
MSQPSLVVIGAGAWGTALACAVARARGEVLLWDHDTENIRAIEQSGRNERYLPGIDLAEGIIPITSLEAAAHCQYALLVVPFQVMRSVALGLSDTLGNLTAIACAAKGFELDSGAIASEIIAATMSEEINFAQVSGPNFAKEVALERPAAITVGARDEDWRQELISLLHSKSFRPYGNDDPIGVQIGGALKNVIAIATGISDGLQLGANTRAALITRGLAEMARFGSIRGAQRETFMGLSGMGDLVLTCTDDQSRNRRFGVALAKHKDVDVALAEVGSTVEGVATARALRSAAHDLAVELPICGAVAKILDGEIGIEEAVSLLLSRNLVQEMSEL